MRLTDILSGANLDIYASVSLTIFLVIFALVIWRVIAMPKREARDAAQLPLNDGTTPRRPRKEHRHV